MTERGDASEMADEFQERIRRFFRGRLSDPDDVDDMVQEALCAILESFGRFKGLSSPSTWVYAICRNVYGNHLYYGRRGRRLTQVLHAAYDGEPPQASTEIRILVEGLSASERELYELFYVQALGIRAIAGRLGRPEGTVKYLLFRMRRKIRGLLGES
jgi:RNA polymerase sigma-70 factor, ECF subfamily